MDVQDHPDSVPQIAFDGLPKPTPNASLDIAFLASDDYGIAQAWAEIKPLDEQAKDARPLYPLPEYRLDLPRRNAREAKGTTSRNLSEHPLAASAFASPSLPAMPPVRRGEACRRT